MNVENFKPTINEKNKDMFFAFGDIETGGLNQRLPNQKLGMEYYCIFEIAFIVTDRNLNPIGKPLRIVINQSEEDIQKSSKWALEQHTKSGLLDEVRRSTITLQQAEKMVMEYFKSLGIEKYDRESRKGAIFAGNSIMLDRDYFMAQTPELHDYMHYRQLDVSAFALACRAFYPEVAELAIKNKTLTHLALKDIEECIEEMRVYRDKLFFEPQMLLAA
tara:strand:+ start:2922 stop:3575 length:654 start_codon:yes stop_codon:yes gene_type:complete